MHTLTRPAAGMAAGRPYFERQHYGHHDADQGSADDVPALRG